MFHKTEIAAPVVYTAGSVGIGIGHFMSTNWLQLLSAAVIIATYLTNLFFQRRRDRREERLLDEHLQMKNVEE